MNQTPDVSLLSRFGNPQHRVKTALTALGRGHGILLVDDEDRENEGDLIFAAEHLTAEQMALLIRECSGIVCLCLTDEHIRRLELPMMVSNNTSKNGTAFTVTIEAKDGVTTGVSAQDRVTTIRTAINKHVRHADLAHPGHVFPLRAQPGGVICELTNPDGTMARLPEVVEFAERHDMPVLSIEDLVIYRETREAAA